MAGRASFRRIDVGGAQRLAAAPDTLVLDVRDAAVFVRGHIDRAQNITMGDLSALINGTNRQRPILICCYHGHASQAYAEILTDFGFAEVYSLDGGYEAWAADKPAAAGPALDPGLAAWLATRGFDPLAVDSLIANKTTPLMQAAREGDLPIMAALIASGAALDARNADGNTAIWLACVDDHLDAIDMLVAAGCALDNQNDNGATPLMYAASAGKASVVARLLEAGASTALATLDDFTALDMAATIECLALLRGRPVTA